MDADDLMRHAIEAAQRGIEMGQSPFGCAIARGDQLLACQHNTVLATPDITAHAEINALRAACLATGNVLLDGCVVATTCEPCPMCMSALHWAREMSSTLGRPFRMPLRPDSMNCRYRPTTYYARAAV